MAGNGWGSSGEDKMYVALPEGIGLVAALTFVVIVLWGFFTKHPKNKDT